MAGPAVDEPSSDASRFAAKPLSILSAVSWWWAGWIRFSWLLARLSARVAQPLRRVLEIHELVGSGTTPTALSLAGATAASATDRAFPEAGQTIAGFDQSRV